MAYTYDEARAIVSEKCVKKDRDSTEAVIFDEWTYETSFGWVFHDNSATYHKTRDQRHAWAGPGPILFNKETGEIRCFGSGIHDDEHIKNYEFEIEARNAASEWCIRLDNQDYKVTALRLRRIFELDGCEALKLSKKWAPYFFFGKRQDLEPLCEALTAQGLVASIELLRAETAYRDCLVWRNDPSFHEGYVRALRTFNPAGIHARKDLDGKEVFMEGVLSKSQGMPVGVSLNHPSPAIQFRQKVIIEKLLKLEESYKDLSLYDLLFKGVVRVQDDRIEMDQIGTITLTHRTGGWGTTVNFNGEGNR